jgi:hypothetical protein
VRAGTGTSASTGTGTCRGVGVHGASTGICMGKGRERRGVSFQDNVEPVPDHTYLSIRPFFFITHACILQCIHPNRTM